MIISEVLRKYPLLEIIDRIATKDYKIQKTGLVIEKGTSIFITVLGLHYDQKYFANPKFFDPVRFSDKFIPSLYMLFGIGPRSCIGKNKYLLKLRP